MPASDANNVSPNDLVIEVDGEGVHLNSLDAPSVLGLAVAYLDLLERCAAERDEEITFSGLTAFEKCGSLATTPSDAEAARQAVLDATKLLARQASPTYGIKGAVDHVRESLVKLPAHYRAIVKVRGLVRTITDESTEPVAERPWATTTLRARVQRVGGARPRATFMSKSEGRAFHLDLKREQATSLGKHLYGIVDIVARVARDNTGYIEDGTLLEFYPVAETGAQTTWTVWRDWFKHSGVRSLDELEENRTEDEDEDEGDRGDRQ